MEGGGEKRIILWMVLLLFLDGTELNKPGVCVVSVQWRATFLPMSVSMDRTLINLIKVGEHIESWSTQRRYGSSAPFHVHCSMHILPLTISELCHNKPAISYSLSPENPSKKLSTQEESHSQLVKNIIDN